MDTESRLGDIGARLATDESAIEAAYEGLAPTVLASLRHMVPPADADDVLQRTFLDVWRSREQYDPARPLAGWVMGIARHRAIDHLRARRPEDPVEQLPEESPAYDDDLAERFCRSHEVREALLR